MGVLTAGIFLGPLYEIQERRNGWPFSSGDYVRVLVGPYRGKIVQVSWVLYLERHGVAVIINGEGQEAFTKTYVPWELLKVNKDSLKISIDTYPQVSTQSERPERA